MESVTRNSFINSATNAAEKLPAEVADEIWSKTLENSAVMQRARRVELPGRGKEFITITGEPTASWVGETNAKPVSSHAFQTKVMRGYKLAVIEPFSNEFKRDTEALYDECINRLPYAIGKAFDETVFDDGMTRPAPGDGFDQLGNATQVNMSTDAWKGLVTADATIAAADGILNGWVITPTAKAALLSAVDNQNRPLFISNVQTDNGVPTLLGSPVSVSKNLANVDSTGQLWGFAGDWTNAIYGVVQDLNVSVSEEATLQSNGETLPLWQHNMFAVRVEFEVGFIVKDPACFVKLVA